MAYQLVQEVLDHAPADLTLAERFVLLVIAEYARDPERRETERSLTDLARRSGLTENAVSKAFRRLSSRGMEVRVPVHVGSDGRAMYTWRGRVPRFRLPVFFPPADCPCDPCRLSGMACLTGAGEDRQAIPGTTGRPLEDDRQAIRGREAGPSRSRNSVAAAAREAEIQNKPNPPATPPDPDLAAAAALVEARLNLDPAGATRAVTGLMDEQKRKGQPIANLAGYVAAVLDRNPQRLAALGVDRGRAINPRPATPLPPLCGQCDAREGDAPSARVLWTADGQPTPCPRCSREAAMADA